MDAIRLAEFKLQRYERQIQIIRKQRRQFFLQDNRAKLLRWGSIGADVYNLIQNTRFQLEDLKAGKNVTR